MEVTSSGFDVFGTGVRTKTLLAISMLEESHARELAIILGAGVTTVRNALETLEQAGLVVSQMQGNTRRTRLNPRFRALPELKALLEKLALSDLALQRAISQLRRRPRRVGKDI